MKYEIFLNGGFANIPKQYEGEVTLADTEKKELLETLKKTQKPSNEIHDGFIYHVKIVDLDVKMKSVYDEHNLPQIVRTFIDSILHKKED